MASAASMAREARRDALYLLHLNEEQMSFLQTLLKRRLGVMRTDWKRRPRGQGFLRDAVVLAQIEMMLPAGGVKSG